MNDHDLARFDRPALERLWDAARHRIELSGRTFGATALVLADLTDDEIEAVCGLLGRRRPTGRSIRVDLSKLDAVLTATAGAGVIGVLEAIGDPVRDRRGERDEAAAEREIMWALAGSRPVAVDNPKVAEWLASLRSRGRITRLGLDEPAEPLMDALAVLDRLHLDTIDKLPLAVLAAGLFGDAHRLDPTDPIGVLVGDAVKFISGAESERVGWAHFGIEADMVNSSALTLNLPGADGSLLAAARGEPLRITGRMIRGGLPLGEVAGRRIRICENPSVVAVAADEVGADCGPLVCTEGMPGAITTSVLAALSDAGADLRVHTDFDVGGMAIARFVMGRFDATPWRLTTAAYIAALDRPSIELSGTVGPTDWDPTLSETMNKHRRVVHEEAILDMLLDDLLH